MARGDLVNWRGKRAKLEEDIADREVELVTGLRAGWPDASEASIERKGKEMKRTDARLRELRSELLECNFQISVLEADVARTKVQVEIAVARMTELGGYFQYLAVIKQAETTSKAVTVPAPGDDWPPSPS